MSKPTRDTSSKIANIPAGMSANERFKAYGIDSLDLGNSIFGKPKKVPAVSPASNLASGDNGSIPGGDHTSAADAGGMSAAGGAAAKKPAAQADMAGGQAVTISKQKCTIDGTISPGQAVDVDAADGGDTAVSKKRKRGRAGRLDRVSHPEREAKKMAEREAMTMLPASPPTYSREGQPNATISDRLDQNRAAAPQASGGAAGADMGTEREQRARQTPLSVDQQTRITTLMTDNEKLTADNEKLLADNEKLVADKTKLLKRTKKLKMDREQLLGEREAFTAAKRGSKNDMAANIVERNANIRELKDKLEYKTDLLSDQNTAIDDMEKVKEMLMKEKEVASKLATMKDLKKNLTGADTKMTAALNTAISEVQEQVAELKADLVQKKMRVMDSLEAY